jgi:DNA-binding transcriptional LysR family regulator
MTYLQLEVFLMIYENGSFTKTAEKLNMTQSAISHSIAALERDLNIILFDRGKKGVHINESGLLILPHVREIFNQQQIIIQKTMGLMNLELGVIKIGCIPSFTARLLPDLILGYRQKYPKIEFQILDGDYKEIALWIKEGKVDLGISVQQNEVEFLPFKQDPMNIVMSSSHPLANAQHLTIKDLIAEAYINVKGYEIIINQIMEKGGCKLDFTYNLHHNPSIIAMIEAGLGISILPELAIPHDNKKIQTVPLYPAFSRTIGLLLRSVHTLTPAAKSFMDFTLQYFAG